MYLLLSEKIRKKFKMKYLNNTIIDLNNFTTMEGQAKKKLKDIIPILYENFLDEESVKCLQAYASYMH